MNRYWYFLFIFLIVSCSLVSKRANNKKMDKDLYLYTMTYDISQDSILVKTFIAFPNSNLVFVKKDEQFEAMVESSLRIENNENGFQVQRVSNTNKIVKEYYEDTRSSELHQMEHYFLLKKGDYKITVSIKDLDSFSIWDASKNIGSSNQESALFLYYYNSEKKYSFDGKVPLVDTLWVEIPKYQFEINDYKYTILKDNNVLNKDSIENCIEKNNNLKNLLFSENNNSFQNLLFECPILITDNMIGDIEIQINTKLNKSISLFASIYKESSLWSSDINAILGVMSYILSYSEIKELYRLSQKDQLEFVSNYIDSKDLVLETNKNEFLELIKIRYQYANNHFSKYNIGWKTDRGEIYIVNGPPESIELMYDNNKMSNKEIWYYQDRMFVFSDEMTFGELKLVKEL